MPRFRFQLQALLDFRVRREDELKRRLSGKQALISVLTDQVTADVLDASPDLRIVANIAVLPTDIKPLMPGSPVRG